MNAPGTARSHGHHALRWAGAAGALGAAVFLLALVIIQARAGASLSRTFVSDYANGPYGIPFTVVVLLHASANIALAIGLWRDAGAARPGRAGTMLFGLASLGLFISAVFPTDAPDAARTARGAIHLAAAGLSFLLELTGLVILAWHFRTRPAWQSHAGPTQAIAVIAGAALLWLAGALATGSAPGIPERIAIMTLAVWEAWTGGRLWCSRTGLHPRTPAAMGHDRG